MIEEAWACLHDLGDVRVIEIYKAKCRICCHILYFVSYACATLAIQGSNIEGAAIPIPYLHS